MKQFPLTALLILTLSFTLFSCEEEDDVVIDQEAEISLDSLFFSCTIDNEYLEFKTPVAEIDGISAGTFGYKNMDFTYVDDTIGLTVSRTFSDDRYLIEFTLCDSLIIDTLTSYTTVMGMKKEVLLKEMAYPIQFYSIDQHSKERPLNWYLGFSITIRDKATNETYTSNIDYHMNKDKTAALAQAMNEIRSQSSFTINHTQLVFSLPAEPYYPGVELLNFWFIEATLNCNLYKSGDLDHKRVLTNGIIRGCF